MPNGILQIYTSVAEQAAPLAGVAVQVLDESGMAVTAAVTGADGAAPALDLPAPDRRYSLDEANTAVRPYAVYDLVLSKVGWQGLTVRGVQVFDGQTAIQRLDLLPAQGEEGLAALHDAGGETIVIPPHSLFAGNTEKGGSGPTPRGTCPLAPRVLTEVVVPKKVTVHLGAPNASADNVTVDFQRYIATVASCEVYPTWPDGRKPMQNASKIPINIDLT